MDGSVKPLELNTTFDSYDELKESVAHYQRTNFVQPYKRNARTIEAMEKRASNKFNVQLHKILLHSWRKKS